jgi:murein DD-endopeptidase MepM/ murein hydrolase activator NlpD
VCFFVRRKRRKQKKTTGGVQIPMQLLLERITSKLNLLMARVFIPREILVRADGRVTYITLSARLQKSTGLVACALAVWLMASSTSLLVSSYFLQKKDSEVTIARLAYQELLEDVAASYDQFEVLTGDLDDDARGLLGLSGDAVSEDGPRPTPDEMRRKLALFQSDLKMIAAYNASLLGRIEELESSLNEARLTGADLAETNVELQDEVTAGAQRLAAALDENTIAEGKIQGLLDELASTETARDTNALNAENLQRRISLLETDLTAAIDGSADRDERIALMQKVIASVVDERNSLSSIKTELDQQLGDLQRRLAAVQSSQETVAQQLAERTLSGAEEVENIVTMTGLDVEQLLAAAAEDLNSNKGGPFVDLPVVAATDAEAAELVLASVADLDSAVSRLEQLQRVMRSLPITAPLDNYYATSGFGRRTDPFTNSVAMHEGLDLVAKVGDPVLATAPGTVVYADWQGEYGRLVEIDHGLGITTRYAHLKEISVEVGQVVGYRDQIGLLGSSGRSTGPHVHYEVRFNDRPFNPMNFLKAGRYVFKG